MKFTIDEYLFIHKASLDYFNVIDALYQTAAERDKRNGVKKQPDDTRELLERKNVAFSVLEKLKKEAI